MFSKDIGSRLKILQIFAVIIAAILIARLGYLQIYKGDYYNEQAEYNSIRIIPAMAPRGILYDRNGNQLVINQPGFTVAILPLDEKVSPTLINRLALLLNIRPEDIKKKLDNHVGFDPICLKTDVGPEIWTIIEEQKNNYPGVVIEAQPIRDYIYKSIGAHVFGYVSEISEAELKSKQYKGYKPGEIVGQAGLEKEYDQYLRGTPGGEQVEVDATGKAVKILGRKEPIPGKDLKLTIDMRLQEATEQAIDQQLKLTHSHEAAVVVMNPQTGAILALSSRPAFDPNKFARGISYKDWNAINNNPYHPLDNKAITGEYPPGSVFKIITGTAALNENKVTPTEKIYDSGVYWIIPKHNADGEALGWIDFSIALAKSDNVYFYEMGNRLGIDTLSQYARLFGLGKPTGIDLPYESHGIVASREYKHKVFHEDWYLSETLDAAIGQGFNLVTPIQAAEVMSEIANNGIRYKPYLVSEILNPDGTVYKKFNPVIEGRLTGVRPEVFKVIQNSLLQVTQVGTAASLFGKNFPIKIAGKTGTAENPNGRDHGWFVAYAPFDHPTIVVAVVVPHGGYGAQSAAPIGKKIIEAAFHLVPEPPLIKPGTALPQQSSIPTGVQIGK